MELISSADPYVSKFFRSHSRALTLRFPLLLLWPHGVKWDCDAMADVINGSGKCIVPIESEIYAWNVHFDSSLILCYLVNYLIFHVLKEIKNGLPEDCGLAMSLYSPTVRAGSLTRAQPCVTPMFTMHGQPFLILLLNWSYQYVRNKYRIEKIRPQRNVLRDTIAI